MSIEVKVPALPESVADAQVAAWHKQPGDRVERDENLVDLETDKVVLEVPAPKAGILSNIKHQVGATVVADDILAVIEEASSDKVTTEMPAAEKIERTEKPVVIESTHNNAPASIPSKQTSNITAGIAAQAEASPAVRKLLAENNIDPNKIKGTGSAGRITKDDVVNYLKGGVTVANGAANHSQVASTVTPIMPNRSEQRVPMSRLRARIAERLVASQRETASLTTFNEVNLQAAMDLRAKYKDVFEKKHGVKLGFMSLFTKAVIVALKKFPAVNASIDGHDILYHNYYDIGIAVSTERGLVVPVVRDADQMSLAQIETSISDYAARARQGKLSIEEMSGGTFTITNGGVFGSLIATPILNPPQVGILGMHKIEQRPIVENGEIVIRPMMYIALTYDHRIIDGKESVQFLVAVKQALEDPATILLDI
ncbi:MAG: 2-oxoglutarate dehydrogenase complex dihydrolipoyllysine-residue succinyltransferase [Gammaproteobacteria bacterium]